MTRVVAPVFVLGAPAAADTALASGLARASGSLADRTVDTFATNAENGDGTDIGSVESAEGPDAPPPTDTGTTPPPVVVTLPGTPPSPVPIRRVRPAGMTVSVSPRRDRTAPYTFRTTGRVLLPAGLTPAQACTSIGQVSVQVKRRGQTISTRRVRLRANCRFTSRVSFGQARRFRGARRLRFHIRFAGNQVLAAIARNRIVRVR